MAALNVGVVRLSQVLSNTLSLTARLWSFTSAVDFGNLGFVLVGVFTLVWIVAALIWKNSKFDTPLGTATD